MKTPRGTWAQLHRTLSSQGNVHIANVHILANLEPFRYGATDFIQRSVQGMENVLDAHGLHLYPSLLLGLAYSADSVRGGKRLLQIEQTGYGINHGASMHGTQPVIIKKKINTG